MYITVIPTSHSISTTPLTYYVGDVFREQIQIGSLVEIPLGRNLEHGIVAGIETSIGQASGPEDEARGGGNGEIDGEAPLLRSFETLRSPQALEEGNRGVIEIKSISQVICSTPLLAPYQIYLIISLAKRYMLPIHRVLGFFLPRPVMSRLEKSNFGELLDTPLLRGEGSTKESKGGFVSENIFSGSPPSQVVRDSEESSDSGRDEQGGKNLSRILFLQNSVVTPDIFREYISPGTIIVCPDDISLYQYEQAFGEDSYFFLPNEATDARRSKAWRDIHNGKYPVVVSPRKILFSNLSAYNRILYLEDAFFGEYFHYPTRIDYLDVLKYLSETGQFQIDILTSIPTLKTLSYFRHFTLQNIA